VPSVEKHPEFAALTEPDQQLVRSLAAILRVAIGLDRNHDSDVAGLEVRDDGGVVRILATPVDGSDLEVEVATGSERAGLLAELLGADVVVSSAS
jgi:exopolyphosphatase/guanosine-5'-triphosphate,3'-diphosphate pyrophosphatase